MGRNYHQGDPGTWHIPSASPFQCIKTLFISFLAILLLQFQQLIQGSSATSANLYLLKKDHFPFQQLGHNDLKELRRTELTPKSTEQPKFLSALHHPSIKVSIIYSNWQQPSGSPASQPLSLEMPGIQLRTFCRHGLCSAYCTERALRTATAP